MSDSQMNSLTDESTWLGLIVDGYLVTDEVGRGGFARIYRAQHVESGEVVALKVMSNMPVLSGDSDSFRAEANQLYSGGFGTVTPHPVSVLRAEFERGQLAVGSGLRCIGKPKEIGRTAYGYREFIEGTTLRRARESNIANVMAVLVAVAEIMDKIARSPGRYHGDLKPENILLTDTSAVVIDPGHFGLMPCREGAIENCVITTKRYYPVLEPDDLFAFGIVAWESLLGIYPIDRESPGREDMGDSVLTWIRHYEILGRHALKGVLHLCLPCEKYPSIDSTTEDCLLKMIRLRKEGPRGKIERDNGFESFAQIAQRLRELPTVGLPA